jgi:hypothetical protein
MRTTSRLFRTVLVAAGLLAISASAAQAMPTRPSTDVGKNPGFAVTGHPGGPSLNRKSLSPNLIGVGYTGQSAAANVSNVYHGFYGGQALYQHDAAAKISSVMSPAVDPANAQQVPIVVTQAVPQPINVVDSGFNWTAGMLGAGIATLVLLLAAITASRIRPQRVAQL